MTTKSDSPNINRNQKQLLGLVFRWKTIKSSTVSLLFVLLTHSSLSLLPLFLSSSFSLFLIQLPLTGVVLVLVLGLGRWCRRAVGVKASAVAFVVFNALFVWLVYLCVVRRGVPGFAYFLFNADVIMLLIGLCRIVVSDPGFVACEYPNPDELVEAEACNEESRLLQGSSLDAHGNGSLGKRIRYCKTCKAFVKGFDHHCPGFGNCIGQNNHGLFMALLLCFLVTETSYVVFSYHFARESGALGRTWFEVDLAGSLVISTMLFSLLQVLWQVVFVIWHVYCICVNVKTEEWVNWKKYPEFQLIVPRQSGESTTMVFVNPYDKGILENVKEFFSTKSC